MGVGRPDRRRINPRGDRLAGAPAGVEPAIHAAEAPRRAERPLEQRPDGGRPANTPGVSTCSISPRNSAAFCGRLSGFFCIIRAIKRLQGSVTLALILRALGAFSLRCLTMTLVGFAPEKGGWPVTRWKSVAPNA